jgi:hypothetical protein
VVDALPRIATRSEIARLAVLLAVEPSDLEFLLDVDPGSIRQLSDQLVDVLHDSAADGFRRIAAAARLIPAPLAASVAERALGPASCALIAGSVDRSKALDIARRLRPEFLAEVAVHLDPRRIGGMLSELPVDRIVAAAVELVVNGHHLTVARLAACIDGSTIRAVVMAISDDDLLRIAFVIDDTTLIDDITAELADDRLLTVARTIRDAELWLEGLALFERVGAVQRGRLAALVETHEPSLVGQLADMGITLR